MGGPLVGVIAEDLLAAAFMAAANGLGIVGRPLLDRGVDLYLRRLGSLLTFPVQVKAILLLEEDASDTLYVPQSEIAALSGGYVAVVHLPPPYDQLYDRLFLIPEAEFRRLCPQVTHNNVPCYEFVARFAGTISDEWQPFLLEIDQLASWVDALPAWRGSPIALASSTAVRRTAKAQNRDIAQIGVLWAMNALERAALDRIAIVEDRIRLDPVTLLLHDLDSKRVLGLHLTTGIVSRSGTVGLTVNRHHWFADPDLWMLLVVLEQDLSLQGDVLLIPSADMPTVGFDERIKLEPFTERFRKYHLPAAEFASTLIKSGFPHARRQLGEPSVKKAR